MPIAPLISALRSVAHSNDRTEADRTAGNGSAVSSHPVLRLHPASLADDRSDIVGDRVDDMVDDMVDDVADVASDNHVGGGAGVDDGYDDRADITDAVASLIGAAGLEDDDTDRVFRERAAVDRMTVLDVWMAYKRTGEARYRDRLVEHYMRTHVRRIAARLSSSLPSQVDVDDLTQQGYLGLAESIERYDLDRMAQVKFETFSSHRIFGAMQDYLRAIDPVPRLTRWRSKQMQGIIDQFITENGRPPSVDEIRGLVDLPDPQFKRMFDDMRPAAMVSFSAAATDGDEFDSDGDAMGSFEDPQSGTPLSTVEREDLRSWVTRGLARRDRLIVVLYYYEQLTMKEVGRTVGCSESRVSQRIESIRDCLKSRFVDVELEDEFLFV